jgi:hypothetical protein
MSMLKQWRMHRLGNEADPRKDVITIQIGHRNSIVFGITIDKCLYYISIARYVQRVNWLQSNDKSKQINE